MRGLAVLVAVLLGGATPAGAQDCEGQPRPEDFEVARGALFAGASCALIGETDAVDFHFSFAAFNYKKPVPLPFEASVTLTRLTPDGHKSMEITSAGGTVLVRDGQIGLYLSEAQFERDGWRPIAFRSHEENTLSVQVFPTLVRAFVNGREVAAWPLPYRAPVHEDSIRIAFKGPRGYRGRVLFRDFRVRSLSDQGQSSATVSPRPR